MKTTAITYIILMLMIMSSCFSSKKNTENKSKNGSVEQMAKDIVYDRAFVWDEQFAGYKILSASLSDSTLTISFTYKGKSADDDFNLIFNGMFAKSLPAKATLYLKQETSGDNDFEKTMQFNISKARYNKGEKTIILLHSFEGQFDLMH
ncbi:MAG: hypothetical protein ABIJ16_02485 [Bacteroidota bacterium]